MKIIFDDYTWKARILVAVLISLPILIIIPWGSSLVHFTLNPFLSSSLVLFAFALLLSSIVRYFGVLTEKKLIAKWGGYPSAIIIRWRDNYKSDEFKKQVHKMIKSKLHIQLLSREEEQRNPLEADKRIQDAFSYIKSKIWGKNSLPTHTDNMDYGFARNLFGCRWICIFLCVLSILILLLTTYALKLSLPVLELTLSAVFLLLAVMIEWLIIKPYVKHCAYRYAEHAWSMLDRYDDL